jgi:hypothetical protein
MSGSGGWSSRRRLGASHAAGRVVGAPSARPGLTSHSAWHERLAQRAVEIVRRALLRSERKSRK